MSNATRSPSPFGQQLRRWRSRAALSQVELAARAGTTPRYLSFLETGRSRPGRGLVLRALGRIVRVAYEAELFRAPPAP